MNLKLVSRNISAMMWQFETEDNLRREISNREYLLHCENTIINYPHCFESVLEGQDMHLGRISARDRAT
jgi:hypothetical protein